MMSLEWCFLASLAMDKLVNASGIKLCPPHPGSTDIIKTMSAKANNSLYLFKSVLGLAENPAKKPNW